MDLVTFHSWWTVAMLVLFIGIVVWAWSGKRRRAFEEAARLPLEDDDSDLLPLSPRGRRDGEVADVRWTSAPSSGRAEACAPRREQGERGEPLIPTPSPARGEGSEPSALRATSFTRGDKKHG